MSGLVLRQKEFKSSLKGRAAEDVSKERLDAFSCIGLDKWTGRDGRRL